MLAPRAPTRPPPPQGVYRAYVSNAKFVSAASAPHIAFMATCCVELWGLDMASSYAHAFGAVRQLSQLLRGALAMKSADSYQQVYCWQVSGTAPVPHPYCTSSTARLVRAVLRGP